MMDLRKLTTTFLRELSGAVGLTIFLFGAVLLFLFMATVDYAWEWPIAALFFAAVCGPVVYLLVRFAVRGPKLSRVAFRLVIFSLRLSCSSLCSLCSLC
jgi:hypothetical protein